MKAEEIKEQADKLVEVFGNTELAIIHCNLMIELLQNICHPHTVWVGDDKNAETIDDTIERYQQLKKELEGRL